MAEEEFERELFRFWSVDILSCHDVESVLKKVDQVLNRDLRQDNVQIGSYRRAQGPERLDIDVTRKQGLLSHDARLHYKPGLVWHTRGELDSEVTV